MFRSKSSMQKHTNKHVTKTVINRFSIKPSQSHNDIEAHMQTQTLGQKQKPTKPPFHSFIHHNSSPSTSGHAQSSRSQPLSPENVSPKCSPLSKRTSSESTLDSENYIPDEYEMKLLEEVEIIDEQGNIVRTQKMSTKDVFRLKEFEKILVHINEFHQPIKASGGLCTRFMSLLLKQPNMCPIEAKDWREVKTRCGVRLLAALRGKFSLPQGENVDKVLLASFDDKYRSYKYRMRLALFQLVAKRLNEANNIDFDDPREINYTNEEILQGLDLVETPVNVFEHQWELYKSNLRSTTSKKLSQFGKKARGEQVHTHTTGGVSYARKKYKFKLRNNREANKVEFFGISHETKEGSYVGNASRDFMNRANHEISEKISALGGSELVHRDRRSVIERDVMTELMAPAGRARGYRERVTKSQVTNLSYDLRKMRGENWTNQNNQSGTLLVQVESQRKLLESQNKLIESQNKLIESQNMQIESQETKIKSLQQTIDDFWNEFRLFQSSFQDEYDPRVSKKKKFKAPRVLHERCIYDTGREDDGKMMR